MVNAHQEVPEKTLPAAQQNQDESLPVQHPSVLLLQAIVQIRMVARQLDTLLSHPQICEGMLTQEQKLAAIRGRKDQKAR